MMTKTKRVISGIHWMARGTATMMGLAVMMALTVGLASTALAGTGIGARFDLGKINKVGAISSLVGSVAGPSLRIDNSSAAPGAAALDLRVEPGKPPMEVNSSTKVEGLNADSLDGAGSSDFARRDPETGAAFEANIARNADRLDGRSPFAFFSGKTYVVQNLKQGPGGGQEVAVVARCDQRDAVLSGGGEVFTLFNDNDLSESFPSAGNGWSVIFRDNGIGFETFAAQAVCADFPPLR